MSADTRSEPNLEYQQHVEGDCNDKCKYCQAVKGKKSKLYRICTENVNRSDIEKIVNVAFDGFTSIEGNGYWLGVREDALIIEIVASEHDAELVRATAKAIRIANKQQAVLVQTLDVESELI